MEVNGTSLLLKYRRAIMGVAAILIFIFHVWVTVVQDYEMLAVIEGFVKRTGFVGVDMFFFVSGIGLFYAIQKHRITTFYLRRIKRTYIPFIITALIMWLVNSKWFDVCWSIDEFLGKVTGYDFLFVNIYSMLWFVPAILILYLCFPLYYYLFDKAPSKYQFTIVALVIWLFLTLSLETIIRGDMYGFTNRILVFILGVLTGWMIQEQKLVFTKLSWCLCVAIWILGLYLSYKTNYQGYFLVVNVSNCCIPNLLMATSGSCMLAKIFYFLDIHVKLIGKCLIKIIDFFGMISLEFYCVQEWIGGLLVAKLVGMGGYHPLIINMIVFLCVILAALLLYSICKIFDVKLKRKSS